MLTLLDDEGKEAVVGKSRGYWLSEDDFVSTEGLRAEDFGKLGFPRDWPAVYSTNKVLKSLVGKRGRCAGKHVSVTTLPAAEDLAKVTGVALHPLQSFANAQRAERAAGLRVVKGWAIFEHLDRPAGTAFAAERYWWNALPDGKWLDLTPRPESWPQLLLAEASDSAPKECALLTREQADLSYRLLRQRFGSVEAASAATTAAPSQLPAPQATASAAAPSAPAKATGPDAAAPAADSELTALRKQLAAATEEADEACAELRLLEAEAASLRRQLQGGVCYESQYHAPAVPGEISQGALVRLHGLKHATDLNGQQAVVTIWDEKLRRWKVRLHTGELRAVPSENLELLDESKATQDVDLSTFGCEVMGNLQTSDGEEVPYNLWPLVYSGFLRVRISDKMLARLNVQFDELYQDSRSKSHSLFLQAEMKSGKQLTVVKPDPEYKALLLECCERLATAVLKEEAKAFTYELDTVWTVHQFEGDYNPIHFHTNPKSHFGFSSFLHLMLPPQLSSAQQRLPRSGAHGHHDGVTSFVWKNDGPLARENLELPGTIECELAEGYLYVFPQWLQHMVWPFRGPGERRTVAANVALMGERELMASRLHQSADPGDARGAVRYQYR